jgi:hypothetical protein
LQIQNFTAAMVSGSVLITSIDTFLGRRADRRAQKSRNLLHQTTTNTLEQVTTINGKSLGNLADAAEGRRIVKDIPPENQTSHERQYVESINDE